MSDLGDALTSLTDAQSPYNKAVAYSDGPLNEVFVSRRLRRLLRDTGRSFQTLLGDVVIDAVANKLKITAISSDTDPRTKMIADVDEANAMAQVRPAVMRRALQLGDSYLTAWPVLDEDTGEVVPGQVRVSVHDARAMRVLYDDDEPEKPRLAIQRWQVKLAGSKRTRVDLTFEDRLEHWISKGLRAEKATDFEPYSDGVRKATEDNPFGFPVFHFHGTGLPGEYGKPEHRAFYGTQDTLIKLKSGHMAGVDYHSLPQRVGLREAGSASSTPDDLDEDEFRTSPDGHRTDTPLGDPASTLSSEPGSIWDLIGYKDVKQLDPGDPKAFLDPREAYLREGAVATSTPLHLFDRTGQIPSGEALKTANEPLDTKASYRKTSFDGTWRAFYRFVLLLLGEDGAPVTIAWAPIESTDETTKLAQAKTKQEIGVPVDQSLTEVGYKVDDVERWMADGDGGLPQRVALLAELGGAVANFASAVAAGLLDKAVVQQVVTQVIGDLDEQSPGSA